MEILWLEQTKCRDVAQVGGKVANLSHLAAAHRVPTGFCLSTAAFAKWATSLDEMVVQQEMKEAISSAYAALAERGSISEPRVAVRSSAVEEDGMDSSFAGIFETYLNIVGVEAVIEAVKKCWASAQDERVRAYRERQGQPLVPIQLAVLVQQLITADSSAVVFSANPISGRRDEIVINTSWGLGESIVGGTVTPDTIVVGKPDLAIVKRAIADKQRMTILAADGAKEVPVPRPMRSQPSVTDAQAVEMADLARTLEQTMGWPVDVECAYADGQLYLLQCRPITTLP